MPWQKQGPGTAPPRGRLSKRLRLVMVGQMNPPAMTGDGMPVKMEGEHIMRRGMQR